MHKCMDCGAYFYIDDAGIYRNPCSYGDRIVYEIWRCCPECGSTNIFEEGEEGFEYNDEDEA